MRKNFLLPLLSLVFLTACASALKHQCESTHWFEYGESVAKKGQRTGTDSFVLQCEKAEADMDRTALSQGFQKGLDEYCTPDFAYRLGKQGEFLVGDLCSGGMDLRMRPRHAEGVLEYCQSTNGENAGTAGKKYNQICPQALEVSFLPEFKKGRKKYLIGLVARKQSEVQDMDREVIGLERNQMALQDEISRLDVQRLRLQNSIGGNLQTDTPIAREIQGVENRMRDLRWENNGLDRKVTEKKSLQTKIREEVRDAQSELSVL